MAELQVEDRRQTSANEGRGGAGRSPADVEHLLSIYQARIGFRAPMCAPQKSAKSFEM